MATLPGSRTHAIWPFALFAVIQLADGVLTTAGVARFGAGVEANPLIRLLAAGAGFAAALFVSKTVSLLGAVVLYQQARHLTLAVLTLAYVMGAIVPWTVVLAM